MNKLLNELLEEINDNTELLFSTYKQNNSDSPLQLIFRHAYLPRWKFLLPEGTPPFKVETGPEGMNTSKMISETRRFHYLCDSKMKAHNREDIFISMLEAIHEKETEVLIAIKEQNLTSLYPNLTDDVLIKSGYLPPKPADFVEPVAKVAEPVVPKTRKPRTPKTTSFAA
jgi:hypothetical protein